MMRAPKYFFLEPPLPCSGRTVDQYLKQNFGLGVANHTAPCDTTVQSAKNAYQNTGYVPKMLCKIKHFLKLAVELIVEFCDTVNY